MSNIEAYQAAPQSYVQLLLFDSTRKIHWRSASNTNEISDALLGDCMHKFFASLSISSALFDGISLPITKKKDKDHHHVYLNRRHISLPHRNRALVVGTRSDHILTGYPLTTTRITACYWRGLRSPLRYCRHFISTPSSLASSIYLLHCFLVATTTTAMITFICICMTV